MCGDSGSDPRVPQPLGELCCEVSLGWEQISEKTFDLKLLEVTEGPAHAAPAQPRVPSQPFPAGVCPCQTCARGHRRRGRTDALWPRRCFSLF